MSVTSEVQSGTLYIVPTPIGNLQDITQRAVDILSQVTVIAAEDTRHSKGLMQHLGIATPLISLHEHNELQKSAMLIRRLQQGESIALISDAGTPLISDPGYVLVKQCRQAHCSVVALPGPCAFVVALSGAGLPTDRFMFAGFLPVKQKAREAEIHALRSRGFTTVFYESPRRIVQTLNDIHTLLGDDHPLAMVKEISKTFEHYEVGSATDCLNWLHKDPSHQKGEFVLIVGPSQEDSSDIPQEAMDLLKVLSNELPPKKAAGIVAEHYDLKKNALYQHLLAAKE